MAVCFMILSRRGMDLIKGLIKLGLRRRVKGSSSHRRHVLPTRISAVSSPTSPSEMASRSLVGPACGRMCAPGASSENCAFKKKGSTAAASPPAVRVRVRVRVLGLGLGLGLGC